MKRISNVGLCLVAMFALGAIAASSASAGEYGVCLRVKKVNGVYTGKWNDKACEASESNLHDGKYEWYPGLTGIGQLGVAKEDFQFTSKDGKLVLSSAAGEIICKKGTDEGEVLGAQYNVEKTVYEQCTLSPFGGKCTGLPENDQIWFAGNIPVFSRTYLIDHGTMGSGGHQPKELEVWNAYFATPSEPYYPYMTEFECGPGILFRVGGAPSAVVTSGKMTDKWETTFGKAGEPEPTVEVSENNGNTWTREQFVLKGAASSTTRDKSKIEIRECNEEGAVSEGMGAFPCEKEEPLPW